jgi:hypothetical protein
MSETQHCNEDQFASGGIASIIFAPPQQNSYLSIVTLHLPLLDAIALECLTSLDESIENARTFRTWLKDTYGQQNDTSSWVAEYFHQATTTSSVTLTLPSQAEIMKTSQVGARRFPFGTHLDLSSSPSEGTFFDPDDFVDR